jgi:predicted RNA binding protein YcfA (HicA-like mRNA interferase family)
LKLPREISGVELVKVLSRLGYSVTRQTGSHIRLTRSDGGEKHLTIPAHAELKVGTLHAILRAVSQHTGLSRDELIRQLFS